MLLLDLWGKLATPGAVFADITWVGFTGATCRRASARPGRARRGARDAAVALRPATASRAGRDLAAGKSTRAARQVLIERRLRATTSSTAPVTASGEEVHGNGVHMDDYETHDDRRLMPGTGFTIEPGLYFETFGSGRRST